MESLSWNFDPAMSGREEEPRTSEPTTPNSPESAYRSSPFHSQGRSDEPTRALLLEAIQKEPLNFWLWHAHSTLCAREQDIDGAIEVCRLAVEEDPDNPSPIMELTNLYAGRTQYLNGLKYGLKLWRIDPARLQYALTVSRNPLVTSIVDDLASKEASLEL